MKTVGFGRLAKFALLLAVGAAGRLAVAADTPAGMATRQERFDRDPGWEGFNNRLKIDPRDIPVVVQDFGYSDTNFAGGEKGEIGGQVWRCTTPAYYAEKISPKTLNEKLSASGRFAFTAAEGGAGVWFGWFNGTQESGSARPRNGFGLNLDFGHDCGRLAVRLSNSKNKFCGTFITPYVPGRFRPAPLSANAQYDWRLTYDPDANAGNGRFTFAIKTACANEQSSRALETMKAEAQALPANVLGQLGSKHGRLDFDDGQPFTVDLPPGFKQDGAIFDRFGLMNTVKEGRQVRIYFDDLEHDGKSETFAKDPNWEGSGNRARIEEANPTGYHNFGFSPDTSVAGGSPGEIGGTFWRLTKGYSYYGDRIGPLSLADPLEASGKVVLKVGTPDSEICFGFFSSSQKDLPFKRVPISRPGRLIGDKFVIPNVLEYNKQCFVGVYLDGPSRTGRCLMPAICDGKGNKVVFKDVDKTPKLTPGQVFDWSVRYVPPTAGANGTLTVKLGEESVTLAVDPKFKNEAATLDRFGVFASGGAGMVNIFFDDLTYTSAHR